MDLARHDLIWLSPAAIDQISLEEPDARSLVADWIRAGHPTVVRRAEIAWTRGIALGIPLPLKSGRKRLALFAPEHAVVSSGRMPLIADAIENAPAQWRDAVRAMASDLSESGAEVRAYGSLAWQHIITGSTYLHPQSDIDLLIYAGPKFDFARAMKVLREAASLSVPHLDGEILIERDRAVAWRELLTATNEVMTRSRHGIALESRLAVLSLLSQRAAA